MSTRLTEYASHAGDHSHRKNAPNIITASGSTNTNTGWRVRPPIANDVPAEKISIGSANSSAGLR